MRIFGLTITTRNEDALIEFEAAELAAEDTGTLSRAVILNDLRLAKLERRLASLEQRVPKRRRNRRGRGRRNAP